MSTTSLPKKRIQLMIEDHTEQLFVINKFKEEGIAVYTFTTEYDFSFPYLVWDTDKLTQTNQYGRDISGGIFCETVIEFLNYFGLSLEPNYEIY